MNIEKIEKSAVKFTMEVTVAEFKEAIDKAFEVVKKDVNVDGFRKGHVPRSYYDKHFGVESLYEEAMNQIIPDKYYQVIKEEKIYPVGQPDFDVDWTKVNAEENFSFTCTVPVKPEVTLGQYTKLQVAKMNLDVTDEEVDAQINTLLTKDAELVVKGTDVLAKGDTAIFDFDGSVDGVAFEGGKAENFELEIGSGQFIPGFEEQMVGMKKEEEKDINVSFPEEYHAKDLAGKPAVFKVKLHEIKCREAKKLDEEFVKSLNKDGISTVEELKADTKKNLAEKKAVDEKNRAVDQLVEKATAGSTFEIPDCMIEDEKAEMLKRVESQAKQYGMELDMFLMLNGMDKEAFMVDIAAQATKRIGYELVIAEIMMAEKIIATKEEVEAKYNELATMYNQPVDDLKKQIAFDQLAYSLSYEKTIDFLVDNADWQ